MRTTMTTAARRSACLVLLIVAAVLGATACGGGDGGSSAPDPSGERRVALQVSPTTARPGEALDLRVVSPSGEPYEYGLGATLERRGPEGGWTPTHRLSLGEPPDAGRHAPVGEGLPILAIAYADDRTWRITVPPELTPGTYRVVSEVTVGEPAAGPQERERSHAGSAELTIIG